MKQNLKVIVTFTVFCLILTVAAQAGWEKSGSHYEYKLKEKLNGSKSNGMVTYWLSLSPPKGEFIMPSSFTGCSKENDSASNVAAKKVYDTTQSSGFDFSFSMSGKLKVDGEGTGSLTWSTSPKLKPPLRIEKKEEAGLKATFYAYRGDEACSVSWSGSSV